MKQSRVGMVVVLMLLCCSLFGQAQQTGAASANAVVPTLVSFSGVLTGSNGKPLTTVTGVTFSLYAEQEGGAPLWLETQNVQPDKNGNYTVQLGATTSQGLPSSLFASGQARWLGVQAQGQAEQPRIMLLSVPYALKAGDAQTLNGQPASAFATASSGNAAGANGVGNNAITGSGTTDYVPLWLSKTKLGSSKIFQSTAGDLGIGTTSPAANLDVNGTSDIRNTLTLFPNGSSPTLSISGTAFALSSTGSVTFVSGQTFPGTGTVTSVGSGAGLTGGPITGSGTLSVATGGVTNAMLQNSKVTLNANTAGGLTTPGAMTLGSTYTIGLQPCSTNQVLQFNGTNWNCAAVGTVTSVGSGAGLTGGPITTSGTLSVPNSGITNAMLQNSSLTVNAGTALTGGGLVALGNSTTLNVDTTKVPLLSGNNSFTGNQAITGSLSATGNISASGSITGQTGSFGANSLYPLVYILQSGSGDGLFLTAGQTGIYAAAANVGGYGVYGGTTGGTGVYGDDSATSGASVGVLGKSSSSSGYGVQGTSPYVGVYGASAGSSQIGPFGLIPGVWGDTGAGVDMGVGVMGTADGGSAGYFENNSPGGAPTLAAFADSTAADSAFGILAEALCCSNEGVVVTYNVGVWGDTGEAAGTGTAVVGTADDNWAAHFYNNSATHTTLNAQNDTSTPGSLVFKTLAPQFKGDMCTIDVEGALNCTGSMSADVPVDGGARKVALYAVEAPDNWFEDAGSGQLSNGSARIELDPTFAQTVNTGMNYHVFLTPNGDCKGLYVSQKSATSFEVHELGGGTSSIAFDYRIMAKRSGYENVRLADVTERYRQFAEEQAQQRENQGKHPMPQRLMRPPASPNSVTPPRPALPVRAAVRPLNTENK